MSKGADRAVRRPDAGWNRFFLQFLKDLRLWVFLMVVLALGRWFLIFALRSRMGEDSGLSDILAVSYNGIRFDSQVAGYFAIVPVVGSVACLFTDGRRFAERLRAVVGVVALVVTVLLFATTLGYFIEYDDQFNYFLLEFVYDDTAAILETIWHEYHPLPNLLVGGVLVWGASWLLLRFLRRDPWTVESLRVPIVGRILLSVGIFAACVIAMRGSFGSVPAKRETAAATADEFLNKTVLNPYTAMRYAIQDHVRLEKAVGLRDYLPDEDVAAAAQTLLHTDAPVTDLDAAMARHAAGAPNDPPKQIFLLVVESYDAWSMKPEYASLRLKENLKDLASRGLSFDRFLPSSTRTMSSLCSILTGLCDAGVLTDVQPSARTPYPSSIAETFERLGYRSRFFYGGYMSWHRLGEFIAGQGFDEVYGAAAIGGNWLSKNEWGVDDASLFDFVLEHVDASSPPGLNVILTTSSHPPYDIDLEKEGCPLAAMPADLAPLYDGHIELMVFGHYWYADMCVGRFVSRMERQVPRPLFAVTGDHYSRRFLNSTPDCFERSAVPFVLYGPDVLAGRTVPERAVGSHIDILPTLVETAAPAGFAYTALGRDLLDPDAAPRIGVGLGRVMDPDVLVEFSEPPTVEALGDADLGGDPDVAALRHVHDLYKGISWWRIVRGSRTDPEPP